MVADVNRETLVTAGYAASIPAVIRRRLGIEPGDALVWSLEEHRLSVTVRKRRRRAFDDFEPFDFGEATDATRDHDLVT